jgi:hypothetical protein
VANLRKIKEDMAASKARSLAGVEADAREAEVALDDALDDLDSPEDLPRASTGQR